MNMPVRSEDFNGADRRRFLMAAPAAGLVAMMAGAVPVAAVASAETPVAVLFREWRDVTARIGTAPDAEVDDLLDYRGTLEIQMAAIKAVTTLDALIKVSVVTDFGAYGAQDTGLPEAWDDVRTLIGEAV